MKNEKTAGVPFFTGLPRPYYVSIQTNRKPKSAYCVVCPGFRGRKKHSRIGSRDFTVVIEIQLIGQSGECSLFHRNLFFSCLIHKYPVTTGTVPILNMSFLLKGWLLPR